MVRFVRIDGNVRGPENVLASKINLVYVVCGGCSQYMKHSLKSIDVGGGGKQCPYEVWPRTLEHESTRMSSFRARLINSIESSILTPFVSNMMLP